MALSLTCTCGVHFEVDDTLAGQEVTCPECQRHVKAPALPRGAVHTSDWAIVSTVLALVGAFTVIGTLAAVVAGIVAVVRINRQRDRLAGIGYAVFGIICGIGFTALSLFAYASGELFGVGDAVRERVWAGKLDYRGDLTIVRKEAGFSIKRSSTKWGVVKAEYKSEIDSGSDLLLMNPKQDTYLDVVAERAAWEPLERHVERLLDFYRSQQKSATDPGANRLDRMSDFKLREKRVLPPQGGHETAEFVMDLRVGHQPLTYLIRVVKSNQRVFVIRTWTMRKRFSREEGDLREILDSFRVLD